MSSERTDRSTRETETTVEHLMPHRAAHSHAHRSLRRPLQVMKFGGTSVADAACIRRVVEIIHRAAQANSVAVVVSAMSGVTNKLIEAATQSESGNRAQAARILKGLRHQHEIAVNDLIASAAERELLLLRMKDLFEQCDRWCDETEQSGRRALPMRDLISSLGERLSAPMVAAALTQRGVPTESIEATELVVTDEYFGGADPKMDPTRERCLARVLPLLQKGVVPIVTGFIGATEDATLTTLGRGGSDFSATILGAALGADEVTIWTDVNGMLTADPHLVPSASTIPEISYREAAELAYFGAKVLHPKTLRPVMQCGIPVWIRNTFAPEKAGTKITPNGHAIDGGVKALTAVSDAALITLAAPSFDSVPEVVNRTLATASSVRADVLMICHAESRNHVCLVVAAVAAPRTVEALRREFASNGKQDASHHVSVDSTVSILTVVGQDLHVVRGIVRRAANELSRENVSILATAQGSSECNVSFVVARKDIKTALVTTHREFQLGALNELPDSRSEAQLL